MTLFFYIAYSLSVDCPDMINLASTLNMDIKQRVRMNRIKLDCCGSSTGITCVNQRVTEIQWSALGLNGFINESAITSEIQNLYLYSNFDIHGAVPDNLPSKLRRLQLNSNSLNGTIPRISTPNLLVLRLFDNKLTGNIPELPNALTEAYLNKNLLTGNFPSVPPTLESLSLSSNLLSGKLPEISQSKLTVLYIDDNLFSGALPAFPNTLENLYLGYPYPEIASRFNQFSGVLSLFRPKILCINDNLITEVIFTDSSAITYCDLSNNPLLPHVNDTGLQKCTMNALYNPVTSVLPKYSTAKTTSTRGIITSKSSTRKSTSTIYLQSEGVSDLARVSINHFPKYNYSAYEWVLIIVRCVIDIALLNSVISNSRLKKAFTNRNLSKSANSHSVTIGSSIRH
eukprot:NODE_139_length_17940_cov_0.254190.p4 type:complete len:399 gc:universal NODE_139_length_17940_cov_0.254190:7117-5921(-)